MLPLHPDFLFGKELLGLIENCVGKLLFWVQTKLNTKTGDNYNLINNVKFLEITDCSL
jgi:hypothetical protein